MSHILALDSSTDACSVALSYNGKITSIFEMAAKSHTQRLLPMVDEILHQSACELNDLDAIAFGRGPGSFTGLRICLGVVQGLAFGLGIPVVPVSTLAAMAAGYYRLHSSEESPLLVALDARMDEIYWGLFQRNSQSLVPDVLAPECVMSPATILDNEQIQTLANSLIGVGPGWHYPELSRLSIASLNVNVYPHAEDIAHLAQELFARGEYVSAAEAQPVYLRDQVSWQKRQRIRSE